VRWLKFGCDFVADQYSVLVADRFFFWIACCKEVVVYEKSSPNPHDLYLFTRKSVSGYRTLGSHVTHYNEDEGGSLFQYGLQMPKSVLEVLALLDGGD